jgi:hypothetical protein
MREHGQTFLEGHINLDGYDNEHRPEHFQTSVKTFIRAELLDTVFESEPVVEIRELDPKNWTGQ